MDMRQLRHFVPLVDSGSLAEIDSLPLLMHSIGEGLGVTIQPMAAIHLAG